MCRIFQDAVNSCLGGSCDDQSILDQNGMANIVPTDGNALVFARTAREVLNIVYFAPNATSGGFFPNGINAGTIHGD